MSLSLSLVFITNIINDNRCQCGKSTIIECMKGVGGEVGMKELCRRDSASAIVDGNRGKCDSISINASGSTTVTVGASASASVTASTSTSTTTTTSTSASIVTDTTTSASAICIVVIAGIDDNNGWTWNPHRASDVQGSRKGSVSV